MRGDTNFKGSDSSGLSVNFYSVTQIFWVSCDQPMPGPFPFSNLRKGPGIEVGVKANEDTEQRKTDIKAHALTALLLKLSKIPPAKSL